MEAISERSNAAVAAPLSQKTIPSELDSRHWAASVHDDAFPAGQELESEVSRRQPSPPTSGVQLGARNAQGGCAAAEAAPSELPDEFLTGAPSTHIAQRDRDDDARAVDGFIQRLLHAVTGGGTEGSRPAAKEAGSAARMSLSSESNFAKPDHERRALTNGLAASGGNAMLMDVDGNIEADGPRAVSLPPSSAGLYGHERTSRSASMPWQPAPLAVANGIHSRFWHSEDGLDLSIAPASKRRRTTIRRPQTSKIPEEFVANLITNGRCWDEDGRTLEEILSALKQKFTAPEARPADRILLGQILRTGVLAGQRVSVVPVEGGGIEISGHMMGSGRVSCSCPECDGDTVTIAAFEEHSGTSERHLSESIQLAAHKVTLKELCNMLNAECGRAELKNGDIQKPAQKLRICSECKKSGRDLLRCGGGCKTRVHPACAGFDTHYTGPWVCSACIEARIKHEAERAAQRAARRAQKALERASSDGRRASGRQTEGPRGPYAKRGHLAKPTAGSRSGGKPQRVHMAAPTAKVGLSQGRMVRNSHKNKRLFHPDEPNGLKDGETVAYKTPHGDWLLEGTVRVQRSGPCGIQCSCCGKIVSCSQFEAHAGRGSRRAPYDNIVTAAGVTLRRLAAALPSEVPIEDAEIEDEPDAVQEDMLGGCVLCDEKNFQRDGFSDLTVILCDQCEREFHVGCLRRHKQIDLQGLPDGDWFCSEKCGRIHGELRRRVLAGPTEITADYQWQLLHGKDGTHATTWALKACYEILQESFDPIIDQVSGQDLVRGMVYSVQQGEWDHTGMFAAVLRFRKHPVCALVMRAFGDMLAEVPLIATRMEARRKGHARYLMNALGDLLAEVGVRTLSLPAAHSTVETWTHGFGFQPMAADQLLETRESLRLLVFPGTEVLYKALLPDAEPYPAPQRAQPAATAPPGELAVPAGGSGGVAPATDAPAGVSGRAADASEAVPSAEPALAQTGLVPASTSTCAANGASDVPLDQLGSTTGRTSEVDTAADKSAQPVTPAVDSTAQAGAQLTQPTDGEGATSLPESR